tara:strand:- start:674 stop:1468 length:795 start_codon:yes stop_codon:yes gene_type:complete
LVNRFVLYFRRRVLIEIRRFMELYARIYLKRHSELWKELVQYQKKTGSTGCNLTDYYVLYRRIRKLMPTEVLECGTGTSTLVIAHALMENEKETGRQGRVTSMEEEIEYADMAKKLLPDVYRDKVEIVFSPTIEDCYSMFRGIRYQDVPKREYDFVFVDGPKYVSPHDNHMNFDFDYLHILRNSNIPVDGLIDQRVSTVFVLQQLLGVDKIRYSPALGLCHVSAEKSDLGEVSNDLSSANFVPSFRILNRTRLAMHPLIRKLRN